MISCRCRRHRRRVDSARGRSHSLGRWSQHARLLMESRSSDKGPRPFNSALCSGHSASFPHGDGAVAFCPLTSRGRDLIFASAGAHTHRISLSRLRFEYATTLQSLGPVSPSRRRGCRFAGSGRSAAGFIRPRLPVQLWLPQLTSHACRSRSDGARRGRGARTGTKCSPRVGPPNGAC